MCVRVANFRVAQRPTKPRKSRRAFTKKMPNRCITIIPINRESQLAKADDGLRLVAKSCRKSLKTQLSASLIVEATRLPACLSLSLSLSLIECKQSRQQIAMTNNNHTRSQAVAIADRILPQSRLSIVNSDSCQYQGNTG